MALWASIPVLGFGGFRYAGSENAFLRVPFDRRPLPGRTAMTAAVFLIGGAVVLSFGRLLFGRLSFGRLFPRGRVDEAETQR